MLQANNPNECMLKLVAKYLQKKDTKKIIHHSKVSSILNMLGWFNIYKSKNIINHINFLKGKNHMISS